MKRYFSVSFIILIFAPALFALEKKSVIYPWMASFNKAGQFNIEATVGGNENGLTILAGPEIIIGNYFPAGIPLQVGFAVKGMMGISSINGYEWLEWGAAPLATIHWGVSTGKSGKFELRLGIGLGVSGASGNFGSYHNYQYGDYGLGFAIYPGIVWHFTPGFSIIIQGGYTGFSGATGFGLQYNT